MWTFLMLVFLLVPLGVVVLFSFHSGQGLTLPFEGLSTRWYHQVLYEDPELLTAARNSGLVSISVAAASFVIGTATAYGMSRMQSRSRRLLTPVVLMPLAVPGLFIGAALLAGYGRAGVSLSLFSVGLAHFIFVFPLFFFIANIAFQRLDRGLEEAAADLGAPPWTVFRRVTFPQVYPILFGAAAIAFMISFDEFLMTNFVIGSDQTVPVLIFQRIRRTIDPTVNVIAGLVLAITLIVFLVTVVSAFIVARRRGRAVIDAGA